MNLINISFNKNFPYRYFLLTLPYGFLHLMLPRGLISFANRPRHQLEINLITNILPWTIGRLWIHHKILMSTNAPTSRFNFASFWCKEDEAWSFLFFFFFFNNGLGFTGTQGFHPSAIWASFIQCCILQLCHPMCNLGFFFFYNPLIYSVQVIEVGTAWAKVIEAGTVWTKPQFQVSLPSCPSYLDVWRIWAQRSSCHLWTPSL